MSSDPGGAPGAQDYANTTSHETLLFLNKDMETIPQLAAEWAVDDSGTVWTIKLQEGVQFHKGWGEFKAEDVVWSMERCSSPDSLNQLQNVCARLFAQEGGGAKVIDDYTLEVNTVTRQGDFVYRIFTPGILRVNSKKHFQEVSDFTNYQSNAAGAQAIGTGPWEFVDQKSGEFWKYEAVVEHWRQVPEFAELMLREIPEEATRVASFQTGKLDTFQMAFDSKGAVDEIPDVRYMAVANGGSTHLGLHPNHYVGMGESDFEERRPGAFNCLKNDECPWVSPNPDLNSPEWERARKVREALLIAVDYQEIVDTLLDGEGTPQSLWTWENRIRELDPKYRVREYDPERAKQLLKEAGYEDGFNIMVTASLRGVAAEAESCEAVADYWEDIGISTEINRMGNAVIEIVKPRAYVGLNCHGTGGKIDPSIILDAQVSHAGWSSGFDHPYFEDELAAKVHEAASDAEHWEAMNGVAGFIYDNALDGGLYSANILWPLSGQVNSWIDDLQNAHPNLLGTYEYVTHRE
jgi:peptide/nickel transport system substrate-binding protein